jgi:predicted O-methyltransferase YrrM
MDSIVEIGSWKGRSTHALLSGCPGTVWSVDHFKGSAGEESALIESREHNIWEQFVKNVGNFKNLLPLKMSSLDAIHQFADKSVDMVFIDGDHSYEEVTKDIKAWFPKCRKIICGHDYMKKNVRKAAKEILGTVDSSGNIWFKVK